MAEGWRTRNVTQVIWIINEIYNNITDVDVFNVKKIHLLGDELDGEHLLNYSQSFSSWQTVKGATNVDKKELFQKLKDNSKKTFTTRIIFMKWINSRDKSEYERVRKKEIGHILDILKKPGNYCDLVKWKEKGAVVHEEITDTFETLANGFGEKSGDKIVEKIFEELKEKKLMTYTDHDRKRSWISPVLNKSTPVPWHPLAFYVCANIYKCVVSIQVSDTDEYRIYPEDIENKPTIKFARVESSKYVCLKRDQEVSDCVTVAGCYTSCKQKMTDTIKGQLAIMKEDQKIKIQFNPNEEFIKAQSDCFNKMVCKKKDLQENVSRLEKSLDEATEKGYDAREKADKAREEANKAREEANKAREEADKAREMEKKAIENGQKAWETYDKMSGIFDSVVANKSKLDQEAMQLRQQYALSTEKQKEMINAQVCQMNSLQNTAKDKPKPKQDNKMTPVDI